MGIGTVAEGRHAGILREEVERDGNVLRLAARDGTHKPFAARAACHDNVVAGLGRKDARLVPRDGHRADEACALVGLDIACRTVGKHLQPALEHHVESHLIGTCAHACRCRARNDIVLGLQRSHRTRCEVHRTDGIAHEGQPDRVVGCTAAALLQAAHTLVGEQVGIAILQSGGLKGTVEVDHQVVLGTLSGGALVEVHHPLVAVVHEVYLQSLHAHLGVVLNHLGMLLYGKPRHPEPHADTFLPSVVDKLLHVDDIDILERVAHILTPALVEQDILYAILRSEVDEVFVRLVVDTRLEVDVPHRPTVPPVPAHLAGLDPRCVVYLARSREATSHLVGGDVGIRTDDEVAPGQGALSVGASDIVAFAGDCLTAVAGRLPCLGGFWENGSHLVLARAAQEHAGIVLQVGLREEHLHALRTLEEHGQIGHFVHLGIALGVDVLVEFFARGDEARHGREMQSEGFVEAHREGFVDDVYRALLVDDEPPGHTVVVGTQHQTIVTGEAQRQLVGMVARRGVLHRHGVAHHGVDGRALSVFQLRFLAQALVAHLQGQVQTVDQHFAARHHTQAEVVADVHFHLQLPVGRSQFLYFCLHATSDAEQHHD